MLVKFSDERLDFAALLAKHADAAHAARAPEPLRLNRPWEACHEASMVRVAPKLEAASVALNTPA